MFRSRSSCTGRWPARENMGPPAWVLNIGIRLSFDHLLILEPSGAKVVSYLGRLKEEEEVKEYGLVLPLVQMNRFIADVESQQQPTVRM